MLDRPFDTPDNVFLPVNWESGESLLCLAPHPDDEVLGCAGLMLLAQRQGLHIHTVIVTGGEEGMDAAEAVGAGEAGDAGAAGNRRLQESMRAAEILGLPAPACWNYGDRQLRHSPPLIDQIADQLQQTQARWLLLPALTEPHPDHQALALAGLAAAQQNGKTHVLLYEVGAPTQINTVVDISSVADVKWRALQAFVSQEERHPYLQHAQAMANLRAFVAGEAVTAAEGFWQISADDLAQGKLAQTLAGWSLQRQAVGLADTPQQLPLVSIIVRSMNRPTLPEAVASVAAQTYPNIEVIVVNASGSEHATPAFPAQRMALRVVQESVHDGAPRPLDRSAAANLGLRCAQGEFALFLDDDDLLGVTQLESLVAALLDKKQAVAAYAGVRVEGKDGAWIRDYDLPWNEYRLRGVNFLPIHAVMFRISLVREHAAAFDESLPVLEDWDFWCQLAHFGPFVHVPGIAAVYRQGFGQSHVGDPEHDHYWSRWHERIIAKHAGSWGHEGDAKGLAWHALVLDRAQTRADVLVRELQDQKQAVVQLQQQLTDASSAHQVLTQQQELQAQANQQLALDINALQQEKSKLKHDLETQLAHSEAERLLAEKSLQWLQQSLPVRSTRAIRSLLGMKKK